MYGFELSAAVMGRNFEVGVEADSIREAMAIAEEQNPGFRVLRGRALQ